MLAKPARRHLCCGAACSLWKRAKHAAGFVRLNDVEMTLNVTLPYKQRGGCAGGLILCGGLSSEIMAPCCNNRVNRNEGVRSNPTMMTNTCASYGGHSQRAVSHSNQSTGDVTSASLVYLGYCPLLLPLVTCLGLKEETKKERNVSHWRGH